VTCRQNAPAPRELRGGSRGGAGALAGAAQRWVQKNRRVIRNFVVTVPGAVVALPLKTNRAR
jgi:hypothetical protein